MPDLLVDIHGLSFVSYKQLDRFCWDSVWENSTTMSGQFRTRDIFYGAATQSGLCPPNSWSL